MIFLVKAGLYFGETVYTLVKRKLLVKMDIKKAMAR